MRKKEKGDVKSKEEGDAKEGVRRWEGGRKGGGLFKYIRKEFKGRKQNKNIMKSDIIFQREGKQEYF